MAQYINIIIIIIFNFIASYILKCFKSDLEIATTVRWSFASVSE